MLAPYSDRVLIKRKTNKELLAELNQRITFELAQLLKSAHPTREKSHQLAKLLIQENGPGSIDEIKQKISAYFKVPYERRTSGQFLRSFGITPYPWLHSQFLLHFGNAAISETKLAKLAGSLRHYFLMTIRPPKEIVQTDFLHLTLYKLVHPRYDQKMSGLDLSDFMDCWQKTAQSKWGDKHDLFFRNLSIDFDPVQGAPISNPPIPRASHPDDSANELELTQTDLDWMRDILTALDFGISLPPYPLSKGPGKSVLRKIESLVRLINRNKDPKKLPMRRESLQKVCQFYLGLFKKP